MTSRSISFADCGAVRLAYETFGSPADPPILLVMGLATQMLGWPDEFCEALAEEGFHVIRFDNRDIGLSTHLHELGSPDLSPLFTGGPVTAPYLLADMADDIALLLDALALDRVHLVGASMGGMIVQEFAIRRSSRLHSLTSIMSTTSPGVGAPTPAAMAALLTPPATTEAEAGARTIAVYRVIGSPGFDLDEDELDVRGRESFRRAHDPAGVSRQFAAIHASGDRAERLTTVNVPTLVLHGEDDPLVQIEGGRATARAIAGARLVTFAGMGHDLPRALRRRLIEQIAGHARAAGAGSR